MRYNLHVVLQTIVGNYFVLGDRQKLERVLISKHFIWDSVICETEFYALKIIAEILSSLALVTRLNQRLKIRNYLYRDLNDISFLAF